MAATTLLIVIVSALLLSIQTTPTLAFTHVRWSNEFAPLSTLMGVRVDGTNDLDCHDNHDGHEGPSISQSSPMMPETHWGTPPYLAVLTEPDACTSIQRMEQTVHAIDKATMDDGVTLVVVRVDAVQSSKGKESGKDQPNEREESSPSDDNDTIDTIKWNLICQLAQLKSRRRSQGLKGFRLVINNDVDVALKAISHNVDLDGVHVKERDANKIPFIRTQLHDAYEACNAKLSSQSEAAATASTPATQSTQPTQPTLPGQPTQIRKQSKQFIIGTSCHSLQSAIDSYNLTPCGPDYLFVGTCYMTKSHPEKTRQEELEGPYFPGEVRRTLHQLHEMQQTDESSGNPKVPPRIFAIGGINEENCHEPVVGCGAGGAGGAGGADEAGGAGGADGVATIRAVMQAPDPQEVVQRMNDAMRGKN